MLNAPIGTAFKSPVASSLPLYCIGVHGGYSSAHHLSHFADDKAILSKNPDSVLASCYLQEHLNFIQTWFRK